MKNKFKDFPKKEVRIIHIDDEAPTLEITKTFLEKENSRFNIYSYKDPENFMKEVKKGNYDCILTDYLMPTINGIDLANKIRLFSDIPIIMYTGHGSEEVASKAINAGINDYVMKEFYPDHYKVLANRISLVVSDYINMKELDDLRKILEIFVDSMPIYMHVYDADLNLVYYNLNKNAKYTFSQDSIGKNILELNSKLRNSERYEKYLHVLRTGEPMIIEDYLTIGKDKFYVSISVFKVRDGLGLMIFDNTIVRHLETENRKLTSELSHIKYVNNID